MTSHLLLFKFLFKSICLVAWGGSHWYYCPLLTFHVDGAGNSLFLALKKSMAVWTANNTNHTYFPNRYFRRMVVNYMVNHRQLIYKNKFSILMALYGVERGGAGSAERVDPTSLLQRVLEAAAAS